MAAQEAITIIQPREDWLKDDNNLVTLIKSVANFVQGDLLHERPTNTAKMYLALCLGFQSGGVMQVEHAPNLWIDLGLQTFKICLGGVQPESYWSESTMPTLANSTGHGIFIDEQRPRLPAKQGLKASNRLHLLLASLKTHTFMPVFEEYTSATSDVHRVDDETPPRSSVLKEHGRVQLVTNNYLATCMVQLDRLEVQQSRTSIAVNRSYYDLGQAYCRTWNITDNKPGGWKLSAALHKEALGKLSTYEGLTYLTTARGQMKWKKRLQRAHKYCLLVDIFGEAILEAAPSVSISRLDPISLTSLQLLQDERLTNGDVCAIKQRMNTP